MENLAIYKHLYKVALDLIKMGGRFIDYMGYEPCQIVGQVMAREIWRNAYNSMEGGSTYE